MLSLSMEDRDLLIKDMDKSQLSKMTQWFSGVENAQNRYAMGTDKVITPDELNEKYLEVLINAHEFFLSINIGDDFIGFIKGRADYRDEGGIWIMSMFISSPYQSNGLGTRALNLFINDIYERLGIRKFYACIVSDNIRGRFFWENNGFKEYRMTKDYFTLDNKNYDLIILRKII